MVRHRKDPLTFLTRCAREQGDIVLFSLGPARVVLLSHPDLIEEVLITKSGSFRKGATLQAMLLPWSRRILGQGTLVAEGETWLHHVAPCSPHSGAPVSLNTARRQPVALGS